MNELERVLLDIQEILYTIPDIKKVSHGKPVALGIDDTIPAVYINPLNGIYEPITQKKCIGAYDSYEYIRLIINMECQDDLEWVPLRSKIINAILDDNGIWSSIVDRDVVTWANDDFDNHPRKQFEVGFEFRLRAQNLC